MRKSFVALLLIGAAAFLTNVAFGQTEDNSGYKLVNAKSIKERLSRVSRLGSSAAPGVDTTYVGHKPSAFNSLTNPWALGTGPYQPSVSADGVWDWDHFGAGENDSLQGWWPIRRNYNITGGLTLPDKSRPWWGIDYGNQVNYVLNSRHQNRTFGVIGVWHVDGGSTVPGPNLSASPTWAPLNGAGSVWCGLRAHADNNYTDPQTGNPFNADVAQYNLVNGGGTGTSKNYPGYGSQWDQLLYRDVRVADGASITVSFKYATSMSTGADLNAATRVGWFDKDPTAVTTGNFISSTDAGANAPVDSFMVYVGVPSNPTATKHADGLPAAPIFDLKRRWFSEVIDINSPYSEILTVAGNNNATASVTLNNAVIQPMLNSANAAEGGSGVPGGVIRVVFRVKTNSSFSDEGTAYSSGTAGAAMVDDVSITGGASAISSPFDSPSEINNAIEGPNSSLPGPAIGQGYALGSWKSTGKPPGIFHHTHPIAGADIGGGNFYAPLVYNELCGPFDSPARQCNIDGVVISSGDHDKGEAAGGSLNSAEQERLDGFISPTINLVTAGGSNNTIGAGINGVGLDNDDIVPTDDYYVWYDLYAGIYNLFFTGNAWVYCAQSYPANQINHPQQSWGEIRTPPFQIFNPDPQCFIDFEPLFGVGLVATSNASGIPDSIRIFMGKNQQCFRFAVSLGCSPTGGSYFDNIALAFVDLHGTLASNSSQALGSISGQIWDFYNDAFPKNATPGLPGTSAFDTTAAILQTGINNAANTGDQLRPDIPGDSSAVTATGAGVRVDLVFRIYPGAGNYVTVGNKSSGLRSVPSNPAGHTATDFWGTYINNNGVFGSTNHHGTAVGGWDVNTWNSARCDSVGSLLFPTQARGIGVPNTAGTWATELYDGSDDAEAVSRLSNYGILKNRCFLIDTAGATNSTNITCGTGTFPPTWVTTVPSSRTGWDGTSQTKSFTKIIPDGQLTPGSHVEYFFRKSLLSDPATFVACPDTQLISPQGSEGSTDGHRWQEFSVLPDAWKFTQYGGLGGACMLFVDNNDRRGNERAFMGVADSVGLTRTAKFGAHNGWHASSAYNNGGAHANTMDYSNLQVGGDPTIAVWAHGGQAGTAFDMYGVKASESLTTSGGSFGSRLSVQGAGYLTGKDAKLGPTPEMLRTYYRQILIVTGDLNSGNLGPFVNRSQDDVTLLEDFMANTSGSPGPRGVWAMGDGFAQSEAATGGVNPTHNTLLNTYLATTLRDGSYQSVSANLNSVADVIPTSVVTGARPGDIMGVQNTCLWSNDLLAVNHAVSGAAEASFYQNVGANGPYVSGVWAPSSGTRPWISLVDGWDIEHLHSRFDENSFGRIVYFLDVLANVFAGQCSNWGTPTVDVPNMPTRQVLNYMNLANNPLRSGQALVNFGITKADHVQIDVYDVSGRHVRNLADRVFTPGQYKLTWDGTNDAGVQVSRGVYFTQVKYVNSRFVDSKKLTVLK
ncbi:MAG TPA: FlgD immunoglobulin-like domain containing protein [Candidatus Eisenbacteria bacterium]|nr:FlgD immunoglobulin-like domain containing protein [Candidatus Eisenbacteria bacterium]